MKPKVSVIIPCYNDGQYIEEAIASCLSQTYENLEIIVVDDGSDDIATLEKLKMITNDTVKVFFNSNEGPAAARNFAIEKSIGKYILPLDSDDKIERTYVEKAVHILENSSSIGAVYCQAELFGEKSGKWDLPTYSFHHMLLDNIVFITAMFSKEDWTKVGGFCQELKHGVEDYDFWLSILATGKSIYQIQEVLFYYRVKKASRTTRFTSNVEGMKETYALIFKRHKEFYLQHLYEYNTLLRNTLIDYVVANSAPQMSLEQKIKIKIKSVPILGAMAVKIYKYLK